jgi:hypothetical protein
MLNVSVTTIQTPPKRLVDQVAGLTMSLARQDIQVTDMSRAGSLESGIGTDQLADSGQGSGAVPVDIVRLEGRIVARRLEPAQPGTSRFRYFLDGAQKTIPVCRIGLAPVVAAISAAGILKRDASGQPALLGDTLHVNQTWIAPRDTGDATLDATIREIERWGGTVHDPFPPGSNGSPLFQRYVGDYGKALSAAYETAGRLRGELERDLLGDWEQVIGPQHPDDWIVVDGRLRRNVPNAIGLVKDLQTQHLEGDEAIALFDLPHGSRTTAFRYAASADHEDHRSLEGRTMWYMRLWSATGMDARHSLVRIETANDVSSTARIDEISSWILEERLPRATDDPRWPTLLYPIYYLERILKRRLADITAGWPSS